MQRPFSLLFQVSLKAENAAAAAPQAVSAADPIVFSAAALPAVVESDILFAFVVPWAGAPWAFQSAGFAAVVFEADPGAAAF